MSIDWLVKLVSTCFTVSQIVRTCTVKQHIRTSNIIIVAGVCCLSFAKYDLHHCDVVSGRKKIGIALFHHSTQTDDDGPPPPPYADEDSYRRFVVSPTHMRSSSGILPYVFSGLLVIPYLGLFLSTFCHVVVFWQIVSFFPLLFLSAFCLFFAIFVLLFSYFFWSESFGGVEIYTFCHILFMVNLSLFVGYLSVLLFTIILFFVKLYPLFSPLFPYSRQLFV